MGFSSYHNSTPNPAERYYRWKGGVKVVETVGPNGQAQQEQRGGELVFWEDEEQHTTELPFQFCALESTSSVTGYSPTQGRYYSNEVTSSEEPLRIYLDNGEQRELVASGPYRELKGSLPQGAKYQMNLYIFNVATQRIERLNLQGSSLSAWINFGRSNKGIYDHFTVMERGDLAKHGSVEFFPPKFSLGSAYKSLEKSDDFLQVLTQKDKIIVEYMNGVRDKNSDEPQVEEDAEATPMASGEEDAPLDVLPF